MMTLEARASMAARDARDKKHSDEIIDALISWTNADDEDQIVLGREDCCYIRDEIERLREVEKGVTHE